MDEFPPIDDLCLEAEVLELDPEDIHALGAPSTDERLQLCYARWFFEGDHDVLGHVNHLLGIGDLDGEDRVFEEVITIKDPSGFDLKSRYLITVKEVSGKLKFQIRDLEITQEDRDQARMEWAWERHLRMEQLGDGVAYFFSKRDYDRFLRNKYEKAPESLVLRDLVMHGVLKILRNELDENTADKIIYMETEGFRGGVFHLMEDGERRGELYAEGFSAGRVSTLRSSVSSVTRFLCRK